MDKVADLFSSGHSQGYRQTTGSGSLGKFPLSAKNSPKLPIRFRVRAASPGTTDKGGFLPHNLGPQQSADGANPE